MNREIDDGMQHGGLVGLSRDEREIERLSAENKKLRSALSHLLSHVDGPKKEINWCTTAVAEGKEALRTAK